MREFLLLTYYFLPLTSSPHNNKYNNFKNVNNKNARTREKTNFVKSGSIDWEAMDMIINGGM